MAIATKRSFLIPTNLVLSINWVYEYLSDWSDQGRVTRDSRDQKEPYNGVVAECYEPGNLATGPKEDRLTSPKPTNQSLLDRAVETHQRFRLDELSPSAVMMATCARSPNEKKLGGKTTIPHFLFQLAAALENPTIKSLEWHEDGKGINLHAKLYEEEVQQHQDLFPELKNLKSASVLQAWLMNYGFKARVTKTDSDMLTFQHADIKKLPPRPEEAEGSKAEASLVLKQPKKSKKRKATQEITPVPPATPGSSLPPESATTEKKSQRLRPLYQYINYDNPEMNRPSDKEYDLPSMESPSTLDNKTGTLELRITPSIVAEEKGKEERGLPSAMPGAGVKPEVDKSTQVDIDKMLSVCAAHLVPPLSPQSK